MKQKIKKEIFSKKFEGECHTFRFSDLPKDINEDDIIDVFREESYFSENNSYDSFSELLVFREIEETDQEYERRIAADKELVERAKKMRYENYLKLKSEFENDQK